MAEEFLRQFAIRMPNGELYRQRRPDHSSFMASIFGLGSEMTDPKPPRPVIFDTRAEADTALGDLRSAAEQVGVANWGGAIVERLCTPFVGGDPGEQFVGEVQSWLQQQGGQA